MIIFKCSTSSKRYGISWWFYCRDSVSYYVDISVIPMLYKCISSESEEYPIDAVSLDVKYTTHQC